MKLTRRDFAATIAGAACLPDLLHAQSASPPAITGSLTDVPGLRVGHWTQASSVNGWPAVRDL